MKNITLILIAFISISCSSYKITSKRTSKNVRKLIIKSPVFEKSFTGFSLFDPSENKTLVSINGDKYFTPASNTKILTLFSALKILGDSLPAFQYFKKNDSLFILGTGDPTFLHGYFNNKALITFLQKNTEHAFYITPIFNEKRLGPGWAWDDYNAYYQVEKAALPIYGNVVIFNKSPEQKIIPIFFNDHIRIATSNQKKTLAKRAYSKNEFTIKQAFIDSQKTKEIPFIYSQSLAIELLNQYKNIDIKSISNLYFDKNKLKTVYNTPKDTVVKRMMHLSDNFLAEQLLLMCSYKLFGTFNTNKTIHYIKDSLLNKSPSPLNWRDGSGLSRYNLCTPNSLVYVLNQIHQTTTKEQLFTIFPNGNNKSLRINYKKIGKAIAAKTGTLSNNHCLSGYLKCKSGKILIFSFMHNNYIGSSLPVKEEMYPILEYITNNY